MSLLSFKREQVVALSQNGSMNVASESHWDICNELKKGKTSEQVSETLNLGEHGDRLVRWVHCKKCPEVEILPKGRPNKW